MAAMRRDRLHWHIEVAMVELDGEPCRVRFTDEASGRDRTVVETCGKLRERQSEPSSKITADRFLPFKFDFLKGNRNGNKKTLAPGHPWPLPTWKRGKAPLLPRDDAKHRSIEASRRATAVLRSQCADDPVLGDRIFHTWTEKPPRARRAPGTLPLDFLQWKQLQKFQRFQAYVNIC